MAKIELLDQNTINQIAAGEVIERPAAVVKELVENAIDASANAITVEIKEGGISFIRITDNGSGIQHEDIKVAFLRHSTSKIRSAVDLIHVASLGFRGEALSSVAAVAQVELLTKTGKDLTGIRYVIEGGEEKTMEEIGCPEGTTFLVRNLFYNTPARRKFLKSPVTEAGYIADIMERIAVSHPYISFKFISNNQVKLQTSGNGNLKDIIYGIYGREVATNVVKIEVASENVKLDGFIGKPIISRGNRNYENCYINGRYIKSTIINKAIEEAYKSYTMAHRYPFTALHIQIPGELIDVNVHPTKMEIRFRNGEEVYNTVYHAIKEALSERELIPAVTLVEEKEKEQAIQPIPEPFEKNRLAQFKKSQTKPTTYGNQKEEVPEIKKLDSIIKDPHTIMGKKEYESQEELPKVAETSEYKPVTLTKPMINEEKPTIEVEKFDADKEKSLLEKEKLDADKEKSLLEKEKLDADKEKSLLEEEKPMKSDKVLAASFCEKAQQVSLFEDKLIEQSSRKRQRIIGQVFSTYWIVEFDDKMYMIDQHAAHEKVLYERLIASYRQKKCYSQMINPPIILTLSMREEEAIKNHSDILIKIGFEIESFGGKEYAVRAIPNNLLGIAEKEYLIELIDSFVDQGQSVVVESILQKAASMSCKAAVKGKSVLSFEEAEALIDELLTLENPYNCPHGRPTIVSMSRYEIEKKFKRII